MEQKKGYYIVSNKNNRRILVITEVLNVERVNSLDYKDFDAIFIDIDIDTVACRYEGSRLAVFGVSPLFQPKCWLKPVYINNRWKDSLHDIRHIVDGYASTPFDDNFLCGIEVLYGRIEKLIVDRKLDRINNIYDFFIRLCQYAISRGNTSFTSGIIKSMDYGYTLLGNVLLKNMNKVFKQLSLFNDELYSKGYVRRKRFLEKVHLCPKCHSVNLLFIETCPKCQSSDLRIEDMLHHFRCANVAPESEYVFDGQLRCPKCKHFLRHIGVDYDRPASAYSCKQCGHIFSNSKMKVICSDCGNHAETNKLLPYDIWEYEFTDAGIEAFASNKIILNNLHRFIDFEYFIDSLILTASLTDLPKNRIILVMRTKITDDSNLDLKQLPYFSELADEISSKFYYCQLSLNFSFFYLAYVSEEVDKDTDIKNISRRQEEIFADIEDKKKIKINFEIASFIYYIGDNIEEFVQKIKTY